MASDSPTRILSTMTLASVGLAKKFTRILGAHSVVTVADLCATSAVALLAMDGMDAASLLSLRRTLLYYGLALKDDPPRGTPEWDALGLALPDDDEPNYPWSH